MPVRDIDVTFGITSYTHDSLPLSAQRCINAYAETQPSSAKSRIAVRGSPGLRDFATAGSGPIRGGIEMNEVVYVVSGSELYSIDSTGTETLLGTGITGIDPVSMDGNGFEVVITNGVNGFSYLLSTATLAQISDPDFQIGNTVTCINNIFAFDWAGTNKFTISAVLDGRTYAGDFASAESHPDFVKAVQKHNGLLLVLGAKTIEPWNHTGAADFPFIRISGSTLTQGLAAAQAVAQTAQSTFFLGNDFVFYRLSGLSPVRISTYALEDAWGKYTTTSDAFCFAVEIGGHKIVYLTFPTENKTFGFDVTTGLWHERMSYDATGREVKWRAACAITAYNKVLIGDLNSGRVGVLDTETYSEFGDPIITTLVSAPVYERGRNIAIPRLEVEAEMGVGITTGQGSDPQMMMSVSTDGGFTYTAPEIWSSMGAKGVRNVQSLYWDRLGSAPQFVFKLSISDPVKLAVYSARLPGAEIGVM